MSTLSSVLDADACPACLTTGRATSLTPSLPDGGNATLLRCPSCGTEYWRLDKLGADAESEYWEQYKFDLYADGAVQKAYEERYARMLSMIGRLGFHPDSVLDIGGGIGNFAVWLGEHGVTAYMTDIDSAAVAAAKERGVRAVEAKDLDFARPDRRVDAVTCGMSLSTSPTPPPSSARPSHGSGPEASSSSRRPTPGSRCARRSSVSTPLQRVESTSRGPSTTGSTRCTSPSAAWR